MSCLLQAFLPIVKISTGGSLVDPVLDALQPAVEPAQLGPSQVDERGLAEVDLAELAAMR